MIRNPTVADDAPGELHIAGGTKDKSGNYAQPEDLALNLATTYNEKAAPILADKCAPCHNAGRKDDIGRLLK